MTYRRQIVFILAMACMILMSACGAAKPSSDREDASAQTPTVSVTAASSTAEEKTEASEEAAGLVEFIRFRADTTEIRVGQTANVTFSAEITENSLVSEPIALECETDGVIAELKDDGILPDLTAGDGVFTAALALQSAERKNEYYRVSCRNDHSEAVQICFYRDLTQKDYDQMDSVLGEISERDEFEKITAYLTDNPDIEYWTEDKEHSSITFTTTAGMTGVWWEWDGESKGGSGKPADVKPLFESGSNLPNVRAVIPDSYFNRDIAVIRPFYGTDFPWDDVKNCAESIQNELGGTVTVKDDYDVTLDFMKTLDHYGMVLIDSHGVLSASSVVRSKWTHAKPFIVIGEKLYNETSDSDWQAGNILVVIKKGEYEHRIGVGSGFFDSYYQNKTFDDTVFFLGCCYSLFDNSFSVSLLAKGASVVFGFTNPVSYVYCSKMLDEIMLQGMTLDNQGANDAFLRACNKHGWHDSVPEYSDTHLDIQILPETLDYKLRSDSAAFRLSVIREDGTIIPDATASFMDTDLWTVCPAHWEYDKIGNPILSATIPKSDYVLTVWAEHYKKETMEISVPELFKRAYWEVKLHKLGELNCQVLNAEGGEPLPGVTLTLLHEGRTVTAVSGEDGTITLLDLEEGYYDLEYSHPDFVSVKYDRIFIEYDKITVPPFPVEMQKRRDPELKPEIGDLIEFGHYEQDNDLENGPEVIQWRVLDVVDGKALLVSRTCLAAQPYNEVYTDITWEKCTLRKWLNGEFLQEAFSSEEQKDIVLSHVKNDDNPQSHKPGGNDTTDKVFVLSIAEAQACFDSDAARMCLPSRYVMKQVPKLPVENGGCWWWLRSPGGTTKYAVDVMPNGSIRTISGANVDVIYRAVRPALWLDLETSEYQTIKGHTSWKVENHVLTVSGSGAMEDYDGETLFAPWYSMGNTITTIVIEDGITHIGSHAFDFIWATSVSIPDSVTSIGDGAFKTCFRLKKATIPEGVTHIGDEAFYACSEMEELILPDSLLSIGKKAFESCRKLKSVIIPEKVRAIEEYTFAECRALTGFIIPEGVRSIGAKAFWYCSGLTSVVISGSVETIDNSSFAYCEGLTSLIVPEGVLTIGNYAFRECSQLRSLSLPLSVKTIGTGALFGCSTLEEISYAGSEEDWKNIEIKRDNKDTLNAVIIHYNQKEN